MQFIWAVLIACMESRDMIKPFWFLDLSGFNWTIQEFQPPPTLLNNVKKLHFCYGFPDVSHLFVVESNQQLLHLLHCYLLIELSLKYIYSMLKCKEYWNVCNTGLRKRENSLNLPSRSLWDKKEQYWSWGLLLTRIPPRCGPINSKAAFTSWLLKLRQLNFNWFNLTYFHSITI